MALTPNAVLVFDSYTVEDDGVRMVFRCGAPGAGESSYYDIFLTDAELASVSTQPQLRTLVQGKLDRKIRASGIASKLSGFIGQTLTV